MKVYVEQIFLMWYILEKLNQEARANGEEFGNLLWILQIQCAFSHLIGPKVDE